MTDETVNVAEAKKHFSELLGQVAFGKKHILITKRGKPFVALISVKDLEFLKKIKSGPPEDGLLGAVGLAPELEEVAEKTMEGYQRRADDFGREVEI